MFKSRIMRVLLIFAVASLLSVQGCKKKAYKVDPNFVGYWDADYGQLDIQKSNYSSSYYYYGGGLSISSTGTARASEKKNILKIGAIKLNIDQYPTSVATGYGYDVWVMIIDGNYYYRN